MSISKNWNQLISTADKIYTDYGTEAIKTENLLKNLLADLAPECTNEAAALLNALSNQTTNHSISSGKLEDINYLVNHLANTMGLSPEWSENIAICIFRLLGKQDTPTKDTTQTIPSTPPKTQPVTTPAKKTQTPEQKLITSGYSFLKNEKWDKATDRFDQSLKTAQYPRAYIGKLMAQLHISTESELPFTKYDILSDQNWLNAVSIAKGSYKRKLEHYQKEHLDYVSKKIKKPKKSIPVKNKFMHGTGIFFIVCAICYALSVWFSSTADYSTVEFFITTFFMSAVGIALVLFAQDNRKVPRKRNIITFCAVSLGIPLAVMIAGFLYEVAILLFINLFGT